MSKLSFENVNFLYGRNTIVNDFSLEVEEGSFTTLLGPSGCGKTTLLRLIAGFLNPSSGSIKIDGINQNGIAPNLRKVAMVFQDYALFPHMNVAKNILYGFRLDKKNRSKEAEQGALHQTARMLGLEGLLERYPHELSGGQQQRVALARSVILKPQILLMDEPLSSLDAKLRILVREELQEIQQKLGITTVYVTHDQEEALSLSTKIAVIDHGRLLQYGTSREVYYEPKDKFVAGFTGRANFVTLPQSAGSVQKQLYLVRPEWFSVCSDDNCDIAGKVVSKSFLGAGTLYKIRTEAVSHGMLSVDISNLTDIGYEAGDTVRLRVEKKYPVT